jgi:DNA-binding transcriptional LysR family regulator
MWTCGMRSGCRHCRAARRLVPVLEEFNTGDLEPIHAVYLGKPDRLPPRTRAVLDFLQEHVDLRHAERLPALP